MPFFSLLSFQEILAHAQWNFSLCFTEEQAWSVSSTFTTLALLFSILPTRAGPSPAS